MNAALRHLLFGADFAALVRRGILRPIQPTTDTGYKSYSGGRLGLPADKNYCTYPSFETWTAGPSALPDGWYLDGNSAARMTPTRVAAIGSGNYALRLQLTAATEVDKYESVYTATDTGTFAEGDDVTVQVKATATIVGTVPVALQVAAYTAAGAQIDQYTSSALSLTAVPTVFAFTKTGLPATTSYVQARLVSYPIDTGDSLDIVVDNFDIKKSSILTPYGDGSYAGWSWDGAEDQSSSSRAASQLVLPPLASLGFTNAATIAARIMSLGATDVHIIGIAETDYDPWSVIFGRSTAWGGLQLSVAGAPTADTLVKGYPAPSAGDVDHVVARFVGGSTLDLDLNGVSAAQGAATHSPDFSLPTPIAAGSALYIGPLLISPTRKSDAWTAAIQANGGAAFSDLTRLARDFMAVGDMLIPLQTDSVAYVKAI